MRGGTAEVRSTRAGMVGATGSPLGARGAARDEGTIIPLILGFFVLALYVVAGAIAASDAFLDQRALQSVCDGAVLAGANALDSDEVFGSGFGGRSALPVDPVAAADRIWEYLHEDSGRQDVEVQALDVTRDGGVEIVCTQNADLAFGYLFGHPHGIRHRVTATAHARTDQ